MDTYEKKYKEALEWARKVMQGKIGFVLDEVLEKFPELAESEDEKIRKAIINVFAKHKDYESFFGASVKDILAWLEKQGNIDSHVKLPIFTFDDILALQCCMETAKEYKELYAQLKSLHDRVYDAYWLEKQDKPTVIISKFRVGDEIKTSNEESLTITKIDEKGYWSEDLFICNFDDADKWKLVEQKPAWSEEDEKMFEHIIAKATLHFSSINYLDEEEINFLKSLKDRYTWKPSDEQIETLKCACGGNYVNLGILESLYNDLKKL